MNRYATPFRILSALFVILMAAGLSSAWAAETDSEYTEDDCIQCHQTGSEDSEKHMSIEEFRASVHNEEATCQDCHTGVVDDEHQEIEGSGATDCSSCHEQKNNHGLNAEKDKQAKCYNCHTRHNMLAKTDPASSVNPDRLPVTCGECHPVPAGKNSSYLSWFPGFQIASHSKADFSAKFDKLNCLGCHQGAAAHGETEPLDDQTCYKCHSSESDGAMWGRMHPEANKQSQPKVYAAGIIYQVFIGIVLVLIAGTFFRKRS